MFVTIQFGFEKDFVGCVSVLTRTLAMRSRQLKPCRDIVQGHGIDQDIGQVVANLLVNVASVWIAGFPRLAITLVPSAKQT